MKTELAVDYFGTKVTIDDALGIKRSAVSQWGATIPKGRAYQIEVLTDGKLKADSRSTPPQPTPCV
ncbi:Cro/CI family transcriptional regulator [Aeromonas veronii]